MAQESAGCTITIGGIAAAMLSWKLNHAVLWCIFHLFCGWIYVIYALLFRFPEIKAIFQ